MPLRLRQLAKSVVTSGLHWTGADAWVGSLSGARGKPLVLAYHRVVESFDDDVARTLPGMAVTRATFERHLEWVGRHYRFVSLDDLGARLEAGLHGAVAAVTFDDGYRDVYEHALPVLRRHGIPAAVFVVTDLVSTGGLHGYDRVYLGLRRALVDGRMPTEELSRRLTDAGFTLPESFGRAAAEGPYPATRVLLSALPQAELQRLAEHLETDVEVDRRLQVTLRSLTWDDLRAMVAAGLTIGSHSRTHALLTKESTPRVQDELVGSRRALEAGLGLPVRNFAYPDGRWNDAVVAAVEAGGYRYAYTICRHEHPGSARLTIPRRMLFEGSCLDATGRFSAAVLSCHAHGLFELMKRCGPQHFGAPPAARA